MAALPGTIIIYDKPFANVTYDCFAGRTFEYHKMATPVSDPTLLYYCSTPVVDHINIASHQSLITLSSFIVRGKHITKWAYSNRTKIFTKGNIMPLWEHTKISRRIRMTDRSSLNPL